MLVNCPNCGASNQLKVETSPRLSDNKQVLTIGFLCSCGCHFDIDHEQNEAGEWEHNWTSIKWVDAD
jgi:hypothetical protein